MIQPVCSSDSVCVLLLADGDAIQFDRRTCFLYDGEFVVYRAVGSGWKGAHAQECSQEAGEVWTLRPFC